MWFQDLNLRPLDPQAHIWRTRVFSDIRQSSSELFPYVGGYSRKGTNLVPLLSALLSIATNTLLREETRIGGSKGIE